MNCLQKKFKACLGIKKSVPDDIIYTEIDRSDISVVIKKRQYNFYSKFLELNTHESVAKSIWLKYINCKTNKIKSFQNYYNNLYMHPPTDNIQNKKEKIRCSNQTMHIRYRELFDLKFNNILYNSLIIYMIKAE